MKSLAILLLLLFSTGRVAASECVSSKAGVIRQDEPIIIVNESKVPKRLIERAIRYWSSCPSYGRGFPALVVHDGQQPLPDRYLRILSSPTHNSNRCASLKGDTIHLYAFAKKSSGAVVSCGVPSQNLAHELGHFLGLEHAAREPRCHLNIMSTIKPRNARRRRVFDSECNAVDARWQTAWERRSLPQIVEVDTTYQAARQQPDP